MDRWRERFSLLAAFMIGLSIDKVIEWLEIGAKMLAKRKHELTEAQRELLLRRLLELVEVLRAPKAG